MQVREQRFPDFLSFVICVPTQEHGLQWTWTLFFTKGTPICMSLSDKNVEVLPFCLFFFPSKLNHLFKNPLFWH